MKNLIYKNLKGQQIDDHSLEDYRAFDPITQTGIAELQGRRAAQEDRVTTGLLKNFSNLSSSEKKHHIEQTVAKLQASCGQVSECGSTFLAAFIDKKHIYTANVGDSTAFGVIFNDENKIIEFTQINKILHNPAVPSERARLDPRYVHNFSADFARLGPEPYYSLALSRALGDVDFEQYGLIHTPDIDEWQASLGNRALLILACDGFTEADCLKEKDIRLLLEKNQHLPLDEFAQLLAMSAIKKGSQDNVSVMITEINDTSKALGLFDGHGGDRVSECLRQKFCNYL